MLYLSAGALRGKFCLFSKLELHSIKSTQDELTKTMFSLYSSPVSSPGVLACYISIIGAKTMSECASGNKKKKNTKESQQYELLDVTSTNEERIQKIITHSPDNKPMIHCH